MNFSARHARALSAGRYAAWIPWIVVALVATIPFVGADRFVQLAILVGINVLLAHSINILTGYAGEMSIGHAALYGASAYCAAALELHAGWPVWLSVPVGVAFAVALGALISIPAGRVREFYLAMVSLGLGMLGTEVMRQWSSVTGGFSGLTGIPSVALLDLTLVTVPIGLTTYFYLTLMLVGASIWLVRNVIQSHVGRNLLAISTSEIVAGALAISAARGKRFAYMFSAGLAGLAGVLYAHLVGYLSPDAFSVNVSIAILVFPILGGMRTLWGPVLGALCLTLLPDQLQSFGHHQVFIYGMILLFSYSFLPGGLIGLTKRRTAMIDARIARATSRTEPSRSGAPAIGGSPRVRPLPVRSTGTPVATSCDNRPELLRVKHVVKAFGGVRALDNVDLSIKRGSIHGLIGPNGSGKTTLLNVVSGIFAPDSGQVIFDGHEIHRGTPHQIAALGIARTFQHPMLVPTLSVRENVVIGAARLYTTGWLQCSLRTPGARSDETARVGAADETLARVGLAALSDAQVADLPFGRQRLVELARALSLQPTFIMLDEPAAGLAHADIQEIAVLLRVLRDQGMTVLIVEHHMDFLLQVADTVTVLDEGKVIYRGDPTDLKSDARVVAAYLGKSAVEA